MASTATAEADDTLRRVAGVVVNGSASVLPYMVDIRAGRHVLIGDEPQGEGGGQDVGPNPYALLLASLGSCTAITLRMYAERKGWLLTDVRVRLGLEKSRTQRRITRRIALSGDLDEAQRARLLDIAERTPIMTALGSAVPVHTTQDRP